MKNILNLFTKFREIKKPTIKENTFLLWEPCSKSHSEIITGYAKYLIDLGFSVSILSNNKTIKKDLFKYFENKNVFFNNMNKNEIKRYFKTSDLSEVKGLLITTASKVCQKDYNSCYFNFKKDVDKNKIIFVEHDVKKACDNNFWQNDIITLRQLNYKDYKSVVVNPHYFGDIKLKTDKNRKTKFILIGAIQEKRRSSELVLNSVIELDKTGYKDFEITVIGNGKMKNIPKKIRKYFNFLGRVSFEKMYEELNKADFILTSYLVSNFAHKRYMTTATSGNFQLSFGFNLPCIIHREFANINGFDDENSIIYENDFSYYEAMKEAILIDNNKYLSLKENLKKYSNWFYCLSLNNLKKLLEERQLLETKQINILPFYSESVHSKIR